VARIPASWRALSALPRAAWALCAAMLVNRAGTMALPFLMLYLTRRLGASASQAAAVLALYGGASLVAAPLSGRLCDRVGPDRILKASLWSSGLVLLAFPLARSYAAVLFMTLAWALTAELLRPAAMALLADLTPPELRKPAYALNRVAVNLGMSIGPAAGGLLCDVSFAALFVADGATSLLAALWLWRAVPHRPRHGHATAARAPAGRGPLGDRRYLVFLAALLPSLVVFFQHTAAMPLFLDRDLHLPPRLYGFLFTLNTGLILAIELPLNHATAKWPHRRTLSLGAALVALGLGALALARTAGEVAGTVVIWTFGEMLLLPGLTTYVAEIAPEDRRGAYLGLYTMGFGVAFTVAGPLGAWLLETGGGRLLWPAMRVAGWLSAAAAAAAAGRAAAGPPAPGRLLS
jgi:predicted MFS family arabinose efflux permease